MEYVLDRLVTVGNGRNDGCILAAGLGEQMQPGVVPEHGERGFGAAGENNGVHLGIINEFSSFLASRARNEL